MEKEFLKQARDYLYKLNSKLCKIEQEIIKNRVNQHFENLKNETN